MDLKPYIKRSPQAMKTSYFFAYLFLLSVQARAQHTDKIISQNENFEDIRFENVVANNEPGRPVISSKLLDKIPLPASNKLSLSVVDKGRNSGTVVGSVSGREVLVTDFKKNNIHGSWKRRYANGNPLDSGSFNNSLPDGEWYSWYGNGGLRSVRTYSSAKWFAVNREVRKGNRKIYYYPLTAAVNFNKEKFESVTNAAGSFASLPLSGSKYDPPFDYCLHHGQYINYYENGAVKDSGFYKDGLRDGLWIENYPNGKLKAMGGYSKGVKHGGWKYYNEEGLLIRLSEYRAGKLKFKKTYDGILP